MSIKSPVKLKYERKNFAFEIKSIDEDQGIVRGYLSVFNNVDSGKDRVRPGAFKKTISEGLQRKTKNDKKFLWPCLFMHEVDKPIGGFLDAIEDQKGLLVTAQLDITTNEHGIPLNPLATSVFSGFKMGYITQFSIGYKAIQKSYDQEGVRDLTEIQLYEGSAIVDGFAMNEEAYVNDVKSTQGKLMDKKLQSKDFNDRYRQECISDWLYTDFNNLVQALQQSIIDLFMIGDSPEADTLNTVLDSSDENKMGFVQAVQAYVQRGIDLDVSNYLQEQGTTNSSSMYYMSRGNTMEQKAGRAISKATATTLAGHVQTLQNVADQHKSMQAMMDMQHKMIYNVAEDLSSIIDGVAYTGDDQQGQEEAAETDGSKSIAGPSTTPTMDEIEVKKFAAWLQTQIRLNVGAGNIQ